MSLRPKRHTQTSLVLLLLFLLGSGFLTTSLLKRLPQGLTSPCRRRPSHDRVGAASAAIHTNADSLWEGL